MRIPKPWLREQNKCWYVTLDGEQHNLGRDEEKAKEQYADLLSKRKQRGDWHGEQNLRKLLDLYYGHLQEESRADYQRSAEVGSQELWRVHAGGDEGASASPLPRPRVAQ